MAGELTREEGMRIHTDKSTKCPRCGGEIITKVEGTAITTTCAAKGCFEIKGRGI